MQGKDKPIVFAIAAIAAVIGFLGLSERRKQEVRPGLQSQG